MTERQAQLLQVIDHYIALHGYSPSTGELQELLGLDSTSTVHWHLKKLRDLGAIDFQTGKRRTIRVLKRSEA